MVVVIGLDGGSDRLATGGNSRHGSAPSALPKPPAPGVGTNIPVARKGSCETGLSWGMVLIVRQHQFPARPDVHGPPFPAGFGISRFWVRQAPQSARRIGTA